MPSDHNEGNVVLPLHILGGGSIGLFLAASIRCRFPSYPVRVLLREHHRKNLSSLSSTEKKSIAVSLTSQVQDKVPPRLVHVPVEIIGTSCSRVIQNLIVTTKAPDVVPAVQSVPAAHRIFLLGNGILGVREQLSQPTHAVLTTQGVFRENLSDDGLYHVVHGGEGRTLVEGADDLAAMLSHVWPFVESRDCLLPDLWNKLAVNCVVNPLSVIYKCRNGELRQQSEYNNAVNAVVAEVAQVACAVHPDWNSTELQQQWRDSVNQVVEGTARNYSSMYQDVQAARTTEIEYLNGYVVQLARLHGIDCPMNHSLLEQLQAFKYCR